MSPGALCSVLLQLLLTEYRFPNPSARGWVRTFPNHRFHVEASLGLVCATRWEMACVLSQNITRRSVAPCGEMLGADSDEVRPVLVDPLRS